MPADLMRHACYRGTLIFDEPVKSKPELREELEKLIERYKANWVVRNRSGGLGDSVTRFCVSLSSYQDV